MPQSLSATQVRSIKERCIALALEAVDPTCERFPTAKSIVVSELNKERAKLGLPPRAVSDF